MNAKNKPNGHSALPAKSSGANGTTLLSSGLGRAASDDASDLSVANATASSAAAGAEREACADVAVPQSAGRRTLSAGSASRSHKNSDEKSDKEAKPVKARRKVVPGLEPLPIDGEAFVDAVHTQVDLVQLEVSLLKSKDDKIVQRELAYLRELRYGKRAPVADDEPTQIIFDMPGPERDKQ
jgi:hypothetical protein